MHLHTTSRRAAAALATTAVAGLLTIAPAHARQDPGELNSSAARPDGSTLQYSTADSDSFGPSSTLTVSVDDNAVEYLQVALGALGGIAVVGAIAAGSTRRHGHAHPA
ncbi:hypothetical protein ACOCJ4_02735 [Knoellia sp. CPCC 206435]|uniref:hypothetical protein n=1 Tax=Knoellia terrae TaxID=3404797 RepID=UPI003B42BCD7